MFVPLDFAVRRSCRCRRPMVRAMTDSRAAACAASDAVGVCGVPQASCRRFALRSRRFARRVWCSLACALLLPYPRIAGACGFERRAAEKRRQPGITTKMLNTKPHTVTHGVDGDAMTLVFYPDTGCLRFVDARGTCHELRPPHSWFALSSASRGARRGTQAMTEGLNALLHEFCAKRPRWLSARGPAHSTVV